jgi:hypothetical protein
MARLGRHPVAAVLAFVVVAFVVVFGAFLLVVRASDSGPDPQRDAALAMAHRLLNGRESLATDREGTGQYVFRIAYQSTDANVGSTQFATHIGVAVCLRDGRATAAARFSYLHFAPACRDGRLDLRPVATTVAEDRRRWRGEFVEGADQADEPAPRRIG